MKKIIKKIIILSVALLVVVSIELYTNNQRKEDLITIYQAKKDIQENESLTADSYEKLKISKKIFDENMITEPIIGVSKNEIKKGQIVYKSNIDSDILSLENDEVIITILLNIDQANGWDFSILENVDVMIVRDEDFISFDARVYKIFDDKLKEDGIPRYISLIVKRTDSDIYFKNINKSKIFIRKKQLN